jgi:hypothetical protein
MKPIRERNRSRAEKYNDFFNPSHFRADQLHVSI